MLGVIRHAAMSKSSPVKFPESISELENASYSAINVQISIPSSLLLDRKAKGGRSQKSMWIAHSVKFRECENIEFGLLSSAQTAPVAGSIARGMETVLLPTE